MSDNSFKKCLIKTLTRMVSLWTDSIQNGGPEYDTTEMGLATKLPKDIIEAECTAELREHDRSNIDAFAILSVSLLSLRTEIVSRDLKSTAVKSPASTTFSLL
jgi:hypothetical protein